MFSSGSLSMEEPKEPKSPILGRRSTKLAKIKFDPDETYFDPATDRYIFSLQSLFYFHK